MVRSSCGTSNASLSQTDAAATANRCSTSAIGGATPQSDSSEATLAPEIPHGTMAAKSFRSVRTLKANPCEVIQREMCTPMAPSLPASVQTPVRPAMRRASI